MKRKLFLLLSLAFATLTASAQENLASASGCKAEATAGNASAGQAIDGNEGTRWEAPASGFTDGNENVSWTLDLGSNKEFNTIQILWEAAYSKSFKIEVATAEDATNFTPVVEKTNVTLGDNKLVDYSFKKTTARYIKFTNLERGTVHGVSFWEFRVYDYDIELALKELSVTPKRLFLTEGGTTGFTLQGKDQLGADFLINADQVTYTVSPADMGTFENGEFTAAKTGTATITATLGDISSSTIVYVLGSDDAPKTVDLSTVAKFIYPSDDHTDWVTNWNGGSTKLDEITLGEQKAMPFLNLACVFFNNGIWNNNHEPLKNKYASLNLSVYSAKKCKANVAINDDIANIFELEQGWNYLEVPLTNIETVMNMSLRCVDNERIDVILTNIYFKAAKIEASELKKIELSAANVGCYKNGTINLTTLCKDQYGQTMDNVEMVYTVTPAEMGSIADGVFTPAMSGKATVQAKSGEIESNSLTFYVLEGELKTVDENDIAVDKNNVPEMIYPATDTQWDIHGWNGGATRETPFVINDVEVMPFTEFACTFFGIRGFDNLEKTITDEMKSLKMSVYSFEDCQMWIAINNENCATYDLKKGWNYLAANLEGITVTVTNEDKTTEEKPIINNMSLRSESDNTHHDVILTNIYFSKDATVPNALELAIDTKGEKWDYIGEGVGKYGSVNENGGNNSNVIINIMNKNNENGYAKESATTIHNDANTVRMSQLKLNMPTKGNFYNVNNKAAYYNDGKLVDFSTGKYVGDENSVIDESETLCKYTISGVEGDVELTETTEIPFTISEAGYATLYTPKALEVPAEMGLYTATIDEANSEVVLTELPIKVAPKEVALIVKNAGTYTLKFSDSADNADKKSGLEASFVPTPAPDNCYMLQKSKDYATNKTVAFFPYSAEKTIPAFRSYLTYSGTAKTLRFVINGNETTGIDSIGANGADNGSSDVYDMQGRKVTKARKGLYIVGGKKVFVK